MPRAQPSRRGDHSREGVVLPWPRTSRDSPVFTRRLQTLGVVFPVKSHQEATPGQARLLTIAAAAQYLSTTVWQIRTLGWERRIPIIKLGNRYLFDRADLDRFIENQKTRMAVR